MMDDWYGGDMGVGGWLLMTLVWVALLGVIAWAAASLFPGRSGRADATPPERPEQILDARLARGEIDAQTYDALRAKLRTARAERV